MTSGKNSVKISDIWDSLKKNMLLILISLRDNCLQHPVRTWLLTWILYKGIFAQTVSRSHCKETLSEASGYCYKSLCKMPPLPPFVAWQTCILYFLPAIIDFMHFWKILKFLTLNFSRILGFLLIRYSLLLYVLCLVTPPQKLFSSLSGCFLRSNIKADTKEEFCSRRMLRGKFGRPVHTREHNVGACAILWYILGSKRKKLEAE